MLDRKAWIILLLCSAALAVNITMRSKTEQERLAREAIEKKEEKAPPAEKTPGSVEQPAEGTTDPPEEPVIEVEERLAELRTGVAVFVFSTHGGGIKSVEILDHQQVGDGEHNVLLNRYDTHGLGALTRGKDFYVDDRYELVSEGPREVVFSGLVAEGLRVTKKWSMLADEEVGHGYRLRLELTVVNEGEAAVPLAGYGLSLGTAAPLYQREWPEQTGLFRMVDGDYGYTHTKWFKGGKRPDFQSEPGTLDYVGVTNQFFTTILRPEAPYEGTTWVVRKVVDMPEEAGGGVKDAVAGGISLPAETLAGGGGSKVMVFDVLAGPKRNIMLRKIDAGFAPVMNYGWFGAISNILNRALNMIHTHVFAPISDKWSWGYAIVLLTVLIRGLMWPLQNKSTRSMKRMALLKEPVEELKAKYPDDPARMNQEMMKLYREYGINPLGGCLPLLVQIPIFFGFYRMLQYAVELRQAKFLWVDDLSQPDTLAVLPVFGGLPVNVLPIVMAGTMVVQMALTPKTGDKMQARIFMLMPLIFFFFCYSFASALALYWTTSNIFAIAQTLIMKRLPEPELKKKKKGPGFMERMQARAEEMQKQKKGGAGGAGPSAGPKPRKPRGPRTGG